MIETQYNAKVRVLRSDNGGEYQSSDLQKYLKEQGIIHQTTCSNTPQQNGVAERKNRHLLEVVHASLIATKIPISYWGEKNETWELVECPPGKKPVGCRWIYTVKYKADGSIDRFKARLVAKGCKPRLAITTVRCEMPFCMASYLKKYTWIFHQDAWCQKTMSEGVKIEKVIVWVEVIPENMVWKVHKVNESFWLSSKKKKLCKIIYLENSNERSRSSEILSWDEVSRSSEGIFPSQRKYALDLLQETRMSGCQPVNTPIEEGLKLCVEPNQVSTDKGRYQRLVGRLMYLAHTRPNLAYALSVVSQYMHNPGEQHMNAVMRILSVVDDRRSTSGYFTFVGGYLSRQPIRLFCDNKAACDIAHNPVQHDHTKHVEVDRFFIKEKLDDKIVELPKIRSENQLADILTKAVSSQVFSKFFR
ncbi:Retrovirus-related Pol polyprotein from transposon RE1 [Vitis vinifera]|uniref:Retrovirus-related Pol polyprotein from transposon RE1 n=1 Tax=Vitis vinifera TaxID=29760 RepID=A0A438JDL3_VITVI|nr:Retrovirus-related Pol polyprotein from transposon RE1 [Vitis vinifera]